MPSSFNPPIPTPVSIANGGTASTTAGAALAALGAAASGANTDISSIIRTGVALHFGSNFGVVFDEDVYFGVGKSIQSVTTVNVSGSVNAGLFRGTSGTPAPADLGIIIGGGAAILKCLTATATLDFPAALALTPADLTITVTGAALGDVVDIGVPNASVPTGASFFGWVSSANTVTIRYLPLIGGDPASGTFRVCVWQF